MMILGVPPEDERFMLKMTQEIFGPGDPDVAAETAHKADTAAFSAEGGNSVDLMQTALQLFDYFGKVTADRRKSPKDDVASVIANGMIDGAPIGDREAMSYYIIVATAGHDTTSSTAAGGLLELIKDPAEMKKLKDDPSLMPNAIEEMIRWVTPVKHFMRTAMQDYDLRGKKIRKATASASSIGRAIATKTCSRTRSSSRSTATSRVTSPSATAFTCAWACTSRAWS